MTNKHTAVEQLKNEFFGYADPYPHFSEEDKWVITEREFLELIEKAKAMEKEQIVVAFDKGLITENVYYGYDDKKAEQYYNETFKSE